MLIERFNPLNKTFLFKFAKDNCFYRNSGYCIIDKYSYEEIDKYEVKCNLSIPGTPEYCLWFAKELLCGRVTKPAWIHHFTECNHYVFDDGQHRTCVYARLLKKGFEVTLPVEYNEENKKCKYCDIIDRRSREIPNLLIPYFNNIKHNKITKQVYDEYEIARFDF